MNTLLRVENLQKIYGYKNNIYPALNDLSFSVNEGEFLAIMGPSGSGKTTLLNLIATIDKPSNGSIFLDNEALHHMKNGSLAKFRRDKLGFIFQDYNLLDTLTVEENILLPLSLQGEKYSEMQKKLHTISKYLQIESLLSKYPWEISGGEKQRTAAARAFITNPRLILADEPTGALDSKASSNLLNTMSTLNEQINSTILMVTHDPFAASFCKRVLFIKDGKHFSELYREDDRKVFYQKILDVLRLMGGDMNDLL